MRLLLSLAFLASSVHAQSVLFGCVSISKEYVVGAKLSPSGLFHRNGERDWMHAGFSHPYLTSMDYDPRDPSILYMTGGNGLIRTTSRGEKWTILTGEDVTELRDLYVDRRTPGTIYFAHSAGIRATRDGGKTWRELSAGLRRKFTECIRADRQREALLAGTEDGVFRSEDSGATWRLAGASGFQVRRIEQSPHDPCFWLAATEQGGLFESRDCARSFENAGRIGVGANLYDISFDPSDPKRIAVGGWGPGVMVSVDGGKSWVPRNEGLPRPEVLSLVFDPDTPGRLFASVHEEALYVSADAGITWKEDGLKGSHVNRLRFVPEAKRR